MAADRRSTRYPGVMERGDPDRPRYVVWYTCSGSCNPDGCNGHTETLPPGSLLRDAVGRRAELVSKTGRGEKIVATKVRLKDFAEEWVKTRSGHVSEGTADNYRWALKVWINPHLGRKHLHELTIDDVAGLVALMKREGKKAWTIKNVLGTLSRIMAHAVRRGLAPSNPVRGLDRSERPKHDQREMRILSTDEIKTLLDPDRLYPVAHGKGGVDMKPALADHWRPLVSTLVFTGLRISEALNLTWDDIDWTDGFLTVRQAKTRAGERRVVLMPALTTTLKRHYMASPHKAGTDRVFATGEGELLNRRYILRKVLKPAVDRAGVTEVTLHELRHTFASILIGQGMDVTFVADQLGHADPGITLKTYARLFDPAARREEARAKLETAFGGIL